MLNHVIEPLGYTSNTKFVYFVREMNAIIELSALQHTERHLSAYATEAEWKAAFGVPKDQGVDWANCAELMMAKCRKCGPYDPATGRGRGLWVDDDNRLIFNTGAKLHVFYGETYSVASLGNNFENRYRYLARSPEAIAPAATPATAEQCRMLTAAFARFSWQNGEEDARRLIGWTACAMMINLVSFRPQIAITAQKGAGKSAVVAKIVRLFGSNRNCLHVEGDASTEAGLRQTLRNEALPVVIDEFETDRPNAEGILRLLRIASNREAGLILKGQVDGTPQHHAISTCACCAGITIQFADPANASRFVILELEKRLHTEQERKALTEAFAPFNEHFGAAMQRRLIDRRASFETNLATFRTVLRDRGHEDRYADLHGHILAGYWTLCHDDDVNIEQAAELISARSEADVDTDEHDCLNHLLGYRVPSYDATIGELLLLVIQCGEPLVTKDRNGAARTTDDVDSARILEQHGIRVDHRSERIIFANKTTSITSIFARTRWRDGGHAKRFKRLGGDDCGNKTMNFLGARSKATSLSVSLVFPETDT